MLNHSADQKGVADVLGTTFFIILLIGALGSLTFVTIRLENLRSMINELEELDRQRAQERLTFVAVNVTQAGKLNLTVLNEGPLVTKVVNLWVINLTKNSHANFSQNLTVLSGETVINIGSTLNMASGFRYAIWLVTERGSVFSTPWPFPSDLPTFSLGSMSLNSPPRADPDAQFTAPYIGGDEVWFELCNTGEVRLAVTFPSRTIWVNVNTGVMYVGVVVDWFDPVTGRTGPINPAIGATPTNDAPPVEPGRCFRYGFIHPKNKAQTPESIPPGTYRVYLLLVGYDQTVAFYIQDIQMPGTYTL